MLNRYHGRVFSAIGALHTAMISPPFPQPPVLQSEGNETYTPLDDEGANG